MGNKTLSFFQSQIFICQWIFTPFSWIMLTRDIDTATVRRRRPSSGYMWETIQDRAIVTVERQ